MQIDMHHAEVLRHHLTHGRVWDGDQISKRHRDELRKGGLLRRVGDGFHELTEAGREIASRLAAPASREKH